jgi:hypothetical protein
MNLTRRVPLLFLFVSTSLAVIPAHVFAAEIADAKELVRAAMDQWRGTTSYS